MRARALMMLAALAGCLEVPGSERAPMCVTTDDCNSGSGEVCEEGVCWGNPPAASYAAVISPAATTRIGVAATEITGVTIAQNGWIPDLTLAAPMTIAGTVRTVCGAIKPCDPTASVAAEVTVIRQSAIVGGPRYVRGTLSESGVLDAESFSIQVPQPKDGDAPYELIIVPKDDPRAPINPALLAPPLRMEISGNTAVDNLSVALGAGPMRLVKGRIVDGAGRGLAGMRVTAQGRWDAARVVERISTVAYTSGDGAFNLYLAGNALPVIGLIAQAPAGTPAPLLHGDDIDASGAVVDVGVLRMPSYGVPQRFRVPVFGFDPGGVGVPVAGATVTLRAVIDDGLETGKSEAIYEVTTSTDAKGQAAVDLIPGALTKARVYDVRIITPPDSEFASSYDLKLSVGNDGGVLESVELPQRMAITGAVFDSTGAPVVGLTVTPSPAQSLRARVDDATRAQLAGMQPQAKVTSRDGTFVIFVDPKVGTEPIVYDLDCDPPAGATVPRWTVRDVELADYKSGSSTQIFLPEAAYVRGRVVSAAGVPQADSEVRFLSPGDAEQCSNGRRCETAASLVALGASDRDGIVRLVLPRLQ